MEERSNIKIEIHNLNLRLTEHETQRNDYRDEIKQSAAAVKHAIDREIGSLENNGAIASAEIRVPYELLMGGIRRLYAANRAIKYCEAQIADKVALLADDEVWLDVA